MPALQRVRRELVEQRHRFALAEWLDALRESVRREARAPAPLPLINVRVVASVMPELEDASRLLRTDNASARGVAAVERLLRRAGSPMHGDDPERLREELVRIGVLLRRSEATI